MFNLFNWPGKRRCMPIRDVNKCLFIPTSNNAGFGNILATTGPGCPVFRSFESHGTPSRKPLECKVSKSSKGTADRPD